MEYSVGFAVTAAVRDAITRVPTSAWQIAIDAEGEVREGGHVVELTGMLDLKKWPPGMRVIVRRERPHPRAALVVRGDRRVALLSRRNQHAGRRQRSARAPRGPPPGAHARVEDRIRHAKDSGLGRFPSREFAINQPWTMLPTIAADLIAWLRLLALPEALKGVRAKALRYRLMHVPARITRGARRRRHRGDPRTA